MRLPKGKILTFDLEARPTAWIGGDYVGRSLTAYAFKYLGEDKTYRDAIKPGDYDHWAMMVEHLAEAVDEATLCVGHYVRGFDFPLLNADLERVGAPSLSRRLSIDTKIDRLQGDGLSQSLENLANRYELDTQKMPMREPMWEEFNLWQTERSRKWVIERVVTDVQGTEQLFVALEKAGRLKTPAAWDPARSKIPRYRG